jgi:hypothetical protein
MNHATGRFNIGPFLFARFFMVHVFLIAMAAGVYSPASAENRDIPINCQVSVSLMEIDEDAPNMDENSYDLTFFGAAAQKPLYKNLLEYGLETGANFSMENDTNVVSYSVGSSGGTVKVEIDNTWFLLDYFGGGYVAANISKRLRLYAGAGPMLIYGSWEFEPDENDEGFDDDTESHLSAGIYARAALEVAVIEKMSFGAGVRAVASGLEFNDSHKDIKFEGPQYFFNVAFRI